MTVLQSVRRVLVAGANGFIGRHVVLQLVSEGFKVVALDLSKPQAEGSQPEWIVGSVFDESLFSSVVPGCEIVVFLAAASLPASANADLAAEITGHVRTTVKAAEICSAHHVKTFIFASSGGTVYGIDAKTPLAETAPTQPRNAYGVSKLAIEHYLSVLSRLRGMRTVSLRISNPYGEGQRAVRNQGFVAAAMSAAFTKSELACWGDGSIVRDFVYVKDVARAIAMACNFSGASAVINIGTGKGTKLVEVASIIEKITNRSIPMVYFPGRSVDVSTNILDTSRARELLQWEPRVGLEAGLRKTANWWETQI